MVETRRSSAAKRQASSEDASAAPEAAASDAGSPTSPPPSPPGEPTSLTPPRGRSGKRAKVEGTEVETAAGEKAVASVDVLDSSVDNLQGVARSAAGAVAASSSAVSRSRSGGRRKKNRPTRSFATDEGTLWKTLPVSPTGRAEAWGRLISQSSEYPSVHICSTHFTIGHGGKYDLKLTEASPGSLVCKLKHVKRGAALEIYVSKVVHVNGKALDKASKVTLIGGDEVIFSSLGRHAYIFQQLPDDKSSTSSLCSTCVSPQEQHPVIRATPDNPSSKGTKVSAPFGRPPLIPHDKETVSSLYKTMEEQSYYTSEENVPLAHHQLLKDDLKKATISASDISESFDSFPYYLSENTKNVLLSSAYVNLCCKDSTKWTKNISSLCKRVLLSGPAGSEIYQELLVKALAKFFSAKLLILDYSLLSGVSLLTIYYFVCVRIILNKTQLWVRLVSLPCLTLTERKLVCCSHKKHGVSGKMRQGCLSHVSCWRGEAKKPIMHLAVKLIFLFILRTCMNVY